MFCNIKVMPFIKVSVNFNSINDRSSHKFPSTFDLSLFLNCQRSKTEVHCFFSSLFSKMRVPAFINVEWV